MKKLTNTQRMEKLVQNHKEYFHSIIMSFANQFHSLAKEIEEELDVLEKEKV